jgi:1-acyl-sn-glycerol-3-phosphate acyltransferase
MLRAYLFLLIFLPLTFVLALSTIIVTIFDSTGRLYHRHARLWGTLGLLMAGVRVEVAGAERIPADVPLIFMSNHQGNFDILALYRAIPRQFAWIAKEELFNIPVFGHSMRRAGYIPLDRSDGRRALKSVEAAAAAITGGKSVVIFPEGTRTRNGKLLPFKKGGFVLAAKSGAPVVPVTINGSMEINPCTRIALYPGTIRITFGKPIRPSGSDNAARDRLLAQVHAAIDAGLEMK